MSKKPLKSHIESKRYKIVRHFGNRDDDYVQEGALCRQYYIGLDRAKDPRTATCPSCLRVWLWLMWERNNLVVKETAKM